MRWGINNFDSYLSASVSIALKIHAPSGFPVSILYKSMAGRYRPVRVADGPITARYRFIKNASWENSVVRSEVVPLLQLFFVRKSVIVNPLTTE